jgi:hypothetical protein
MSRRHRSFVKPYVRLAEATAPDGSMLSAEARVVVAAIVGEVIDWNRNPDFGLSHSAQDDPRFVSSLRRAERQVETRKVRPHPTVGGHCALFIAQR